MHKNDTQQHNIQDTNVPYEPGKYGIDSQETD